VLPCLLCEQLSLLLENNVSLGVAEGIVETLEVIDIDQHQRQGRFLPMRPFDLGDLVPTEVVL
jgi:hypothetical protein